MSTNDFIDSLERELRAASRRRVRLELARAPRPGAGAVAFAVVLAVCAAVAVPLLATRSGSAPGHQPTTRPPGAHGAAAYGCHDTAGLNRGWRAPQAGTYTVGPISWLYLRKASNEAALGHNDFIVAPVVVQPGQEVTVSVPSSEAQRLSLDYSGVLPRSVSSGESSVTFKPCQQPTNRPEGPPRQFLGGFIVSGPQCATIDMTVATFSNSRQRGAGALRLTNVGTQLPLGRPCPRPAGDVLSGNGIGQAHFGEDPSTVVRRLHALLGRPPTKPYQRANICRIDGEVGWPGLAVYFRHRRFVGYSYSLSYQRHVMAGSEPVLATLKGLRVGDPAARGKRLYGSAFHLSSAQGGSYLVDTLQGRIDGYTSGPNDLRGPIISIEAGYVGCPALTP